MTGRWSIQGADANGAPVELAGTTVEVVRRQADGSWRYAIDVPGEAGIVGE